MSVVAVIIASVATFINILTLFDRLPEALKPPRDSLTVAFANDCFVNLIAFGDLCIGVYLLNIVVMHYFYSESYCEQQFKWLTTKHCDLLGVLSTFGTQLSLFAMVALGCFRAYTIIFPFRQKALSSKIRFKIALAEVFIFIVSATIALIPIVPYPSFRRYFNNGRFYQRNTLFKRLTTLDEHRAIHERYLSYLDPKKERYAGLNISIYSWQDVYSVFDRQIFNDTSVDGLLNFYGSDGVCIFKYMVSAGNTQVGFSMTVVAVNFLCFVLIALSYMSILISVRSSSMPDSEDKERQIDALQRKVALIIATDFLCWIPFCVICILHATHIVNANPYYDFFSIIFIPINSVFNPIIYNGLDLMSKVRQVISQGRKSVSTVVSRVSQVEAPDLGKNISSRSVSDISRPGLTSPAALDASASSRHILEEEQEGAISLGAFKQSNNFLSSDNTSSSNRNKRVRAMTGIELEKTLKNVV
jgi:hypothetical protein